MLFRASRESGRCLSVAALSVAALLAAVLAAGCGGGGGNAKAPPLNQQYEEALKIPSADVRGPRLVAIATKQIQGSNEIGADKTLLAAALAADKIKDPNHKADTYLKIFALRAQAGQSAVFKDLLKSASKASAEIESPQQKFDCLLRLAEAYARDLDRKTTAAARLQDAEAVMPQLSEAEQLGATFRLSGALAVLGEADRAQQLLDGSLAKARELEDPRAKCEGLGDAAGVLFGLDRDSEAQPLLDEASGVASGIKDAEARSHALASLARKLMLSGQNGRAAGFLRQAQASAEEIGDPTMRSSIMDEIAATKRLLQ